MNINATITPDCRHLNIVITGGVEGSASISISNGTYSHDFDTMLPLAGNANHLLFLENTVGTGDGIFQITGTDSSGVPAYAGALGSCSLDCCISKKVDELLKCGCGCAKCNDALTHAERVLLLISGIRADLSQIGTDLAVNTALYETAITKYNKALEYCSDSCGCGC